MFNSAERQFADAIVGLSTANPFRRDEVVEYECAAAAVDLPGSDEGDVVPRRPGVGQLVGKARALLKSLANRSAENAVSADLARQRGLVRFVLYFVFRDRFQDSVEEGFADPNAVVVGWYDEFRTMFDELMHSRVGDDPFDDPAHVFACFFQIRRAYHLIDSQLIGSSRPIQELRAAAWQSVFTNDMLLYGRLLYDRMHDVSTLIVGPSGTGKELVARAIGMSRYIPFDAQRRRFSEPFAGSFHAVNLSALSPTLVESELFGHAKGAFTGAVAEREGWFEACHVHHAVFLDEIGELDPALQVKLLRVLQERAFQRLGETKVRRFEGKVIAATNKDLADEMEDGRFREDFYYRLCSDVIRTPSLRSQLDDEPDDLRAMIAVLVLRQVGRNVPELVERIAEFISTKLPCHPWPGNVRELEQCVRSFLVQGTYQPAIRGGATSRERLARCLEHETPNAEELLTAYCRVLYDELGAYSKVGRVLGLDRRTVQRRVDS